MSSSEAERRSAGKPRLTQDDAVGLARQLFGFGEVAEVKEFVSYDDRNFYLKTDAPARTDWGNATEFILKINNAVDSEKEAEILAQNSMMLHLHAWGIRCPVPLKDVAGRYVASAVLKDLDGSAQRHSVRLLTFLPGSVWDKVPQPPETLRAIGRFVGQVSNALGGFHNPAAEARTHMWDLARVTDVTGLTRHFEQRERMEVVDAVLAKFQRVVLPRAGALKKAVIHGDINEQNLLLHPDKPEVTGLLDFGDILHSWQINDIAITMAYGMLNKEAPLVAASHLLVRRALPQTAGLRGESA